MLAPNMLRVPPGNLGACRCRWAVEENQLVKGRYLFCGAPTDAGKSYRPYHRKLSGR